MTNWQTRQLKSWELAASQYDKKLTIGQVAGLVGRSITHVADLTRDGFIHCERTRGGHRRYQIADVIAYAKDASIELILEEPSDASS